MFAKSNSLLTQNPIQREKMYEALAYFSANVRHPGLIKLLKLVYYLDLMHFRRTGRTVTGLTYEAWPMGPVPASLYEEFKSPSSPLHERFVVTDAQRVFEETSPTTIDTDIEDLERAASATPKAYYKPGGLKPVHRYQQLHLSKREHELAAQLAEIFRDAKAEDMSDISHSKFGPWRKTLHKAKKAGIKRPVIDLQEGVVAVGRPDDELSAEELQEILEERAALERSLL